MRKLSSSEAAAAAQDRGDGRGAGTVRREPVEASGGGMDRSAAGRWAFAVAALGLAGGIAVDALGHHDLARPEPITVAAGVQESATDGDVAQIDPTRVVPVDGTTTVG